MNEIKELFNIDLPSLIIGFFILLSAMMAIINIIGKFSEMIGKPLKWIRKKNEDHELLIATAKNLAALQEKHEGDVSQSIRHDGEIKKELERLTSLFLEKEIDDQRWEILDFASAISSGREFSKEQFDHVLSTYEKYEKILEEHGMRNGQVTASMEVIREVYKGKLINGF